MRELMNHSCSRPFRRVCQSRSVFELLSVLDFKNNSEVEQDLKLRSSKIGQVHARRSEMNDKEVA